MISAALTILVLFEGPKTVSLLIENLFSPTAIAMPTWVVKVLKLYFGFFIIGSVFPFFLFLGFMALASLRKEGQGIAPLVSVVIPAFNEQGCISLSLKTAAKLDYPAYEVIVVDDGSNDLTLPVIENAAVSIIKLRNNRGKPAALNAGLTEAKGDIVVLSDADSYLDSKSLRYLVKPFANPAIGAVAGTVLVDKPNALLRRWQMLEYLFGQAIVKLAQHGNSLSVSLCPGPICAFRRDLLIAMGGFNNRTLTEDFDATLEMIKMGYRVAYEPRAVAYTDAPASWRALKMQRLRWYRGHLQVFRVHQNLFFSKKGGSIGLFWLPFYYLLIGFGSSLLELIMLPLIPVLFFVSGEPVEMLKIVIVYLVIIESFSVVQYVFSIILTKQFNLSLVLSSLIVWPYRFFLNWIKLVAIIFEIKGKELKWSA